MKIIRPDETSKTIDVSAVAENPMDYYVCALLTYKFGEECRIFIGNGEDYLIDIEDPTDAVYLPEIFDLVDSGICTSVEAWAFTTRIEFYRQIHNIITLYKDMLE